MPFRVPSGCCAWAWATAVPMGKKIHKKLNTPLPHSLDRLAVGASENWLCQWVLKYNAAVSSCCSLQKFSTASCQCFEMKIPQRIAFTLGFIIIKVCILFQCAVLWEDGFSTGCLMKVDTCLHFKPTLTCNQFFLIEIEMCFVETNTVDINK